MTSAADRVVYFRMCVAVFNFQFIIVLPCPAGTACADIERITEWRRSPLWNYEERLTYGGHVVRTNVVLALDFQMKSHRQECWEEAMSNEDRSQ